MIARWKGKLEDKQETIRRIADAAETAAGTFAGAYVQGRYPNIAGVPTSAAIALVGVTAGIALEQPDVTAFSLGVGNAYLALKGYELGLQAAAEASQAA
jgi:hypothetical protein